MKIGAIVCGYGKTAENIGKISATLKMTGIYTIIGYDAEDIMPNAEIVNSCDLFLSGGGHIGKRGGELRSLKLGIKALRDNFCEYILKLTGDVAIARPEAIPDLIEDLDGADLICNQWNGIRGTMIFFGRTDKLLKVFSDIAHGIPQLEVKFENAIIRNNIKATICPCHENDRGIWAKIGYERGNNNYPPD